MSAQSPARSRFRFIHNLHPHILQHQKDEPATVEAQAVGFNGRAALFITTIVGTMFAGYIFAVIALLSLPSAIQSGNLTIIIAWISSNFLQLVLLPVIIVGQNLQAKASDKRAEDTYNDASATFQTASQIQEHLLVQDQHLEYQTARLDAIVSALKQAFPDAAQALESIIDPGSEPSPPTTASS